MENVTQSSGRIELLYQNQMIKNMLERISFKNKNVLSAEKLKAIETTFLDSSIDYDRRFNELATLHSYSGEQIKNYFNKPTEVNIVEPVMDIQPSLEKQKVLVKKQSKLFGFNKNK